MTDPTVTENLVLNGPQALRITAPELVKYQIMDEIVPEPLGGAHSDPVSTFPMIKEHLLRTYEKYAAMSAEEIQLDRYAKFRKLGMFDEYVVKGGKWRETRSEREAAEGVYTTAGAWAANEGEARFVEQMADADDKWDALMAGREGWTNKPVQPPGLGRSGVLETAVAMVELRRAKQSAMGHNGGGVRESARETVRA